MTNFTTPPKIEIDKSYGTIETNLYEVFKFTLKLNLNPANLRVCLVQLSEPDSLPNIWNLNQNFTTAEHHNRFLKIYRFLQFNSESAPSLDFPYSYHPCYQTTMLLHNLQLTVVSTRVQFLERKGREIDKFLMPAQVREAFYALVFALFRIQI